MHMNEMKFRTRTLNRTTAVGGSAVLVVAIFVLLVGTRYDAASGDTTINRDHTVTDEQMEAAIATFVGCAEDIGFDVTSSEFRPGRGWSYGLGPAPSADDGYVALRSCEDTLDEIGQEYLLTRRVSHSEIAESFEIARQCLADLGLETSSAETFEELRLESTFGQFDGCLEVAHPINRR